MNNESFERMSYQDELRTYVAVPGRMEDLLERFRNHTIRLFRRHGIQPVTFWVSKEDENRLTYIVRHETDPAANWDAFKTDPEWVSAREESLTSGPLTTEIQSEYLIPLNSNLEEIRTAE